MKRQWWRISLVLLVTAGAALNVGLAGAAVDTAAARAGKVAADAQTPANFDDDAGGEANADDPAIWVHPTNSAKSVVVGSLKAGGLAVFDLAGKQLQRIAPPPPLDPEETKGKFNNVDVLYGVKLGARTMDLIVASESHSDQLRIFSVDKAKAGRGVAPLTDVTAPDVPFVFVKNRSELADGATAYGLAAYKKGTDGFVVTTQEGKTAVGLLKLVPKANGKVSYQMVRKVSLPKTFRLPNGKSWTPCDDPDEDPQLEGLAIDARTNTLYATQEVVGLWKLSADLRGEPKLIDKADSFGIPGTYNTTTEDCVMGADPGFGGKRLFDDVEGVVIYHRGGGKGYVIVSSQGNDTFAVYELTGSNRYIGSFGFKAGTFDSVSHTDGLDVVNVPVGNYSRGLVVVQDGENTPTVKGSDGKARENTNFKFVGWQKVAAAFDPPLMVDTRGYNPRR